MECPALETPPIEGELKLWAFLLNQKEEFRAKLQAHEERIHELEAALAAQKAAPEDLLKHIDAEAVVVHLFCAERGRREPGRSRTSKGICNQEVLVVSLKCGERVA